VTYMGPGETQLGQKESRQRHGPSARPHVSTASSSVALLTKTSKTWAEYAGVPVWNGLTDKWHPTQMLADIFTMRDHSTKATRVRHLHLPRGRPQQHGQLALGDGRAAGDGCPHLRAEVALADAEVQEIAQDLAKLSGARVMVSEEVSEAVLGADFLYTDVWVSMGEPTEEWTSRIDELTPYQVNAPAMKADRQSGDLKFMHCLPAMHDRQTEVGQMIFEKFGLSALEVTDEVFESPASIVFDQAENRLHTIKAIMVATIGS
jgi:ornithine carbamoyltransferase